MRFARHARALALVACSSPIYAASAVFVLALACWHWFGPLSGHYEFGIAMSMMSREFAAPIAWPLCLAAVLCAALATPASRAHWDQRARHCGAKEHLAAASAVTLVLALGEGAAMDVARLPQCIIVYAAVALTPPHALLTRVAASVVSFLAIGYAFTILKATAFMNGANWDPTFQQIDRLLALDGLRAWIVTGAHADPGLLEMSDLIYRAIFVIVVMFAMAASIGGHTLLRRYAYGLFFVHAGGPSCTCCCRPGGLSSHPSFTPSRPTGVAAPGWSPLFSPTS